MHNDLDHFFRVAFSAQEFRSWVRRLQPDGGDLAQALPGGSVDALTLFTHGADLLIRRNYVDAALFTALAREFPKRHAELTELAGKCGVPWSPSRTPPTHPPTRLPWLGLVLTLGLAAALAPRILASWATATAPPPPIEAVMPPAPPPSPEPDASTGAHGTSDAEEAPADDLNAKLLKKPKQSKQIKGTVPALEPEPPPPEPAPVCALPGALRDELQALADKTFRGPGPSKAFTVTLPKSASTPNVSPAPRAGETAIEPLYTHLKNLGPAELGHCRDRPIDVVFSAYHTTVEFQ